MGNARVWCFTCDSHKGTCAECVARQKRQEDIEKERELKPGENVFDLLGKMRAVAILNNSPYMRSITYKCQDGSVVVYEKKIQQAN